MVQAMQEGAQSLSHEEARGVEVLRHLSISKLQGYLKRKHEGDSGSGNAWQQIALTQTSLSEAKAANKEFQEQGQHKRNMLRPAVNDRDDLWSPQVQKFWNRTPCCRLTSWISSPRMTSPWLAPSTYIGMETYIKNNVTHARDQCCWRRCPRPHWTFGKQLRRWTPQLAAGSPAPHRRPDFPLATWNGSSPSWTSSINMPKAKSAFGEDSGRRNGRTPCGRQTASPTN